MTDLNDAYWALADFMEATIGDAKDELHFNNREHALMAAGQLTRGGWLAVHDAEVKAEALREFAGVVDSIAALGVHNSGLRTPGHLAEYARNYAARELDRIDRELGVAHIIDTEPVPESPPCSDHRPVQHRDARPPWCNACGLTEGGEVPTGLLDRRRRS